MGLFDKLSGGFYKKNKLEFSGYNVFIHSAINEKALTTLKEYKFPIKYISFYNYEPDNKDLKILNEYFKTNKQVFLRGVEKGYLEYLPDLENIEYTKFDSSMFEELKHLKNLNGIDFRKLQKKLNLTPLLEYKNTIKNLAFEGDVDKNGEEVISQFKNLTEVTFISSKFKSFEFLSDLSLETFRYFGSRTTEYEHLKNIKSLKHFWLKTNTKWKNFDFLSELENIEIIELWYVSAIEQFPECSHLKYLKKVIAQECNKLENIEELKKLDDCYVRATGKLLTKDYIIGVEE